MSPQCRHGHTDTSSHSHTHTHNVCTQDPNAKATQAGQHMTRGRGCPLWAPTCPVQLRALLSAAQGQRPVSPTAGLVEGGSDSSRGLPERLYRCWAGTTSRAPQPQDRPADLVALTQHMTVFLPGDGLGAGVLGPRKAMWLRGHGAGLQPASPRQARCGAPRSPECWAGYARGASC